jgi:RNA polymerase sigma-70 factor, ECF subfamily
VNVNDFEISLKEIHKSCHRWSIRLCSHPEIAEEILQEAYIKALHALSSFKGESTFKAWIFSIIRNCTYDYFRKVNRRAEIDQNFSRDQKEYTLPPQERNFKEKNNKKVASFYLSKLSIREQEIIELVFYQDIKIKEAALIMGISEHSAAGYLKRAKNTLKGHIIKEKENNDVPDFEKTYTYQLKKTS